MNDNRMNVRVLRSNGMIQTIYPKKHEYVCCG